MFEWFIRQYRYYFCFKGRASRLEYWCFALFCTLIYIGLGIVDILLFGNLVVSMVFGLVSVIPSFGVTARRLHDIDMSGWFQLIQLIPMVGFIVLVILCCMPSQDGVNRFGPSAPSEP